jgi:hypothetical protein
MWSSVVLLECDVVGLSYDERNNIELNNFIPIAYSGQISGDNITTNGVLSRSAMPPHTTTLPLPNDRR